MTKNQRHVIAFRQATMVFGGLFSRNRARALDRASFLVRRGEVFGLLGPADAGKSTALRLLAGALIPTRGAVEVFGLPAQARTASGAVGFISAHGGLNQDLNCADLLLPYDHQTRFTPMERLRRTQEILEFIGATTQGRGTIGALPLVDQRCLELAQSLGLEMDVLDLDDPFDGLDAAGTDRVKDVLQRLSERGKTIVFASRRLSDAAGVCHRVAILSHGQVQAQGTLAEILARPNALELVAPLLTANGKQRVLEQIAAELLGGLPGRGGFIPDAVQQAPAKEGGQAPSGPQTSMGGALSGLVPPAADNGKPGEVPPAQGKSAPDLQAANRRLASLVRNEGAESKESER